MISRYQIFCAVLLFGTVLLYQTMAVSVKISIDPFDFPLRIVSLVIRK